MRVLIALCAALFMMHARGQQNFLTDSLGGAQPSIVNPQSAITGQSSTNSSTGSAGQGQFRDSSAPLPGLNDLRDPLSTTITSRPRQASQGQDAAQRGEAPAVQSGGPRERTEFQNFLLQSTGKELPIFGSNLFSNVPSTFAPLADVPVPSDYVIGPGDEILINGWGQINVDVSDIVGPNGTIVVPKVGTIQLSGVKAGNLSDYLKTVFSRTFRNFELTATLGRLRAIRVYAVGQAQRPGTYTVSSLSTLVTAIFASGGPSSKGSMRSIQLKRNNKVIADFDLYDLLVGGDKSRDVQLLAGDVIYFPPVGSQVAVTGSVNVPAIYELKQNAPLFDLIRWAGGLSTTASGQKATVERIEARKVRTVEDFTLDATGLAKLARDGDVVTVYALTPRFDKTISLRGNVAQPSRFPWREGLRIRDIIPNKDMLLSRDYFLQRNQAVGLDDSVARILRQQSATGTQLSIEDLVQRRKPETELDATVGDTIRRMQTESEAVKFLDPRQAAARQAPRMQDDGGRVQEPTRQEQTQLDVAKADTLRLINQIRPPQREINWDYAVIERLNQSDLTTSLIPFNLGQALEGNPTQNLLLESSDIITVFSKEDVQVPIASRTKYVRLEGEFFHAGVYQVMSGETLRQLVARVGGLTQNAYLFGAQFTRESTRIQQQKNLDEALNRLESDAQRLAVVRSQNVTTPEDAVSLGQQAESQRQLVARLRQVRATGRIVLEVPPDGQLKDIPDLALEDADRFYIPSPPGMISVLGSVYSENSFIYKPQKQFSDYLAQAGGPTRSADESSIYVLRADGSVMSKRQTGFLVGSLNSTRLMPGDSIVVPEELDKTTVMRNLKDIGQIFYQFGLGAAALKVLRD